ncbi:MAG: non-canonical purine NTP pyrophosphatase [Acidaminococcaceae bacterium]|nr:non-canonical purine NTP pyrophosphatase [Acidaminococcaceae bacterium]
MDLVFLSSNPYKQAEVKEILDSDNIHVIPYAQKIDEIQSESMEKIVKDKAKKAYEMLKRPVLVEQTGLSIADFGGLPAGLTQVFWDALQADKFCQYFYDKEVTAQSFLAFCDGKRVYLFSGSTKGSIVRAPYSKRHFQWDCVFQPKDYSQTYAEMPKELKNEISMRRKALDQLKRFLEERYV